MEEIFDIQHQLLARLPKKKRYLSEKIDWDNRLISIRGARGSGKTTILLQHLSSLDAKHQPLYVSLDNLYFIDNTLIELAREFTLNGGTHLYLDEVHKYPNWSREIKLLYDQYPNLKIVFTSSSMLEVYKGESDLSRRAVSYHLKGLSFREYLYFEKNMELPVLKLSEILNKHKKFSKSISEESNELQLKYFKEYLEIGVYPYFLENKKSYTQKLLQTINLILEVDLSAVENYNYSDSRKLKKLLVAISQSAPFTPNISKLSERLGMSRVFLINAIKILNRADLVMELYKPTKGVGALTKPEKLFLENTNLIHALASDKVEVGTLRETFFLNQVYGLYDVHLAEKGDFIVENSHTFEIGGKSKNKKQVVGVEDAYVVKDDLLTGYLNTIPLYLFGFLY